MEGWISLHRKLIDWEWYSDTIVVRVFLHLLLIANHKDANWKGIQIKRGQVFTSYQHIIDGIKDESFTIKKVRNAMQKLKNTGEVAVQRAGNGLLVTIVKYDFYQSNEQKRADLRADHGQTMGNKQ